MNKFRNITILLFMVITIVSCTETKPIPINFVYDAPVGTGNYPDCFKQIAMPFSSENCKEDILLKPINITRLDIKTAPIETNAWYFQNMGDNTVEFSKNWLKSYFKDSIMPKYLSLPKRKNVTETAINRYFKKKDVLSVVFAEDAEVDVFKDVPVFTNAKEVSVYIQNNLCKRNYKEVIVVINPKQLRSVVVTEEEVKPVVLGNPCKVSVAIGASEVNNKINEMLSSNKSLEERVEVSEKIWDQYFSNNAYVALYLDRKDDNPKSWNPGSGKDYFLNRLALLESILSVSIFRVELTRDNKKISAIHLVECQNASQSL